VRAIFPNPRFVLLPGMFMRARIEEGVNENAILVPQVGVTHDPNGQATALVVDADNKAAVHKLQLRGTSGGQWIVEAGLNDGDRVIVAGVQRVKPGTAVKAVEAQPASAAAAPSTSITAPPAAAADAPKASPAAVVSQAK
jgi:membrane fusion protein (multidrug efflux system)